MQEKLFNFLAIRQIPSVPEKASTRQIRLESPVVSTLSAKASLEEKQSYLNSLKPQYLKCTLKGHSPEVDHIAQTLKAARFQLSPAAATTLIEETFKDSLSAVLGDANRQYQFNRISTGLLVNVLENGDASRDLKLGRQVVELMEQLKAGAIPNTAAVAAVFGKQIKVSGEVGMFLREKKDAAKETPKPPVDTSQEVAKQLQELNKELEDLNGILEEIQTRKGEDVIPQLSSSRNTPLELNFEPTLKITYSKAKKDSFSPKTLGFIQQAGLKEDDLVVRELRSRVEQSREKVAQKMARLASPAMTPMVFLNGEFKSIDQVLTTQSLEVIPEPELASFLDGPKYMRPLGIGELKTVEQTNLRYSAGEVAHIENVLAGESKVRDHAMESGSSSKEETESDKSESSSNERESRQSKELAAASQETVRNKMEFDFSLQVKADVWPGIEIKTGTSYGIEKSREKSRQESSKLAREVVERAVSSVQESVRELRSETSFRRVTERNTHTLDNTGEGNGHMVGIYRWLNKQYTAQVRTHGARMMYEFIVPEPAAFHMFAEAANSKRNIQLSVPQAPQALGDTSRALKPADLNAGNYRFYAAQYEVEGISPPPVREQILSKAITLPPTEEGGKTPLTKELIFQIPEGYLPGMVVGVGHLVRPGNGLGLIAHVGKKRAHIAGLGTEEITNEAGETEGVIFNNFSLTCWTDSYSITNGQLPGDTATAELPVSMVVYDAAGLSMTISVSCQVSREGMEVWQNSVFSRIMTAYHEMLDAYEERKRALEFSKGIQISGKNPLRNKEIMANELKKHCISFMTNSYLERYQSMFQGNAAGQSPRVDFEKAYLNGSHIQFFEQAFEWSRMMHQFYPYFWSGAETWPMRRDHDSSDPEFGAFLRAGAARVVLSVREGYEDAVAFYMNTFIVPTAESGISIGDNLYVDIVDLLREEQDNSDGNAEEQWEVTLPTNLVVLDDDDAIQRLGRVVL